MIDNFGWLPGAKVADPDWWRQLAATLRQPRDGRLLLPGCSELLEAEQCDWRALLLDRLWADASAWSVMAEAAAGGMSFDVALMVACPDQL